MAGKALVLDANILIRAVLGQRVRRILEDHADHISFFTPEPAYAEAEEHLAILVVKRRGNPAKAVRVLRAMAALGYLGNGAVDVAVALAAVGYWGLTRSSNSLASLGAATTNLVRVTRMGTELETIRRTTLR